MSSSYNHHRVKTGIGAPRRRRRRGSRLFAVIGTAKNDGREEEDGEDPVVRSIPVTARMIPCELDDAFAMVVHCDNNYHEEKANNINNKNNHDYSRRVSLSSPVRNKNNHQSRTDNNATIDCVQLPPPPPSNRISKVVNAQQEPMQVTTTTTAEALVVRGGPEQQEGGGGEELCPPSTFLNRQVASCWMTQERQEEEERCRRQQQQQPSSSPSSSSQPNRPKRRLSLLDDNEARFWDEQDKEYQANPFGVWQEQLDFDKQKQHLYRRSSLQLLPHGLDGEVLVVNRSRSSLSEVDGACGVVSCPPFQEPPTSGPYLYKEYYYDCCTSHQSPESSLGVDLSQGSEEKHQLLPPQQQVLVLRAFNRWNGTPQAAPSQNQKKHQHDHSHYHEPLPPKAVRPQDPNTPGLQVHAVSSLRDNHKDRSRNSAPHEAKEEPTTVLSPSPPPTFTAVRDSHHRHGTGSFPQEVPVPSGKNPASMQVSSRHHAGYSMPFFHDKMVRKNTTSLLDDSSDDDEVKQTEEAEMMLNQYLQQQHPWTNGRFMGSVVTPPPLTPTSFVRTLPTQSSSSVVSSSAGARQTTTTTRRSSFSPVVPKAPRKKVPQNHYSPIYPSLPIDDSDIESQAKAIRPPTPFASPQDGFHCMETQECVGPWEERVVSKKKEKMDRTTKSKQQRIHICSIDRLAEATATTRISEEPRIPHDSTPEISQQDPLATTPSFLPRRRGRSPFLPILTMGQSSVSNHCGNSGHHHQLIGSPTGFGDRNIFRLASNAVTPPVSNKKIKPSPEDKKAMQFREVAQVVHPFYEKGMSAASTPPTSPLNEPSRSTPVSSITSPSGFLNDFNDDDENNGSPNAETETLSTCTGVASTDSIVYAPGDHSSLTSRLTRPNTTEGLNPALHHRYPEAPKTVLPRAIAQSPLPETFGQVDTTTADPHWHNSCSGGNNSIFRRGGSGGYHPTAQSAFTPHPQTRHMSYPQPLSRNKNKDPPMTVAEGACLFGQWSNYRSQNKNNDQQHPTIQAPQLFPPADAKRSAAAPSLYFSPLGASAFSPPTGRNGTSQTSTVAAAPSTNQHSHRRPSNA